jgi:hypothetical protein
LPSVLAKRVTSRLLPYLTKQRRRSRSTPRFSSSSSKVAKQQSSRRHTPLESSVRPTKIYLPQPKVNVRSGMCSTLLSLQLQRRRVFPKWQELSAWCHR